MNVKRHLKGMKENLEFLIHNPRQALMTATLAAGLAFGSHSAANAQTKETQDTTKYQPSSVQMHTDTEPKKYLLYTEIIPNKDNLRVDINPRKVFDDKHRTFITDPSYPNFVEKYRIGIIEPGPITVYSIDSEALKYMESSTYPKAGVFDPCGYSMVIATKLSEFLNNKDNIGGDYVIGNLTPKEKQYLSTLLKEYNIEDLVIGVIQADEPFKEEIGPNNIKKYNGEKTPGLFLIRSEDLNGPSIPGKEQGYTDSGCRNCGGDIKIKEPKAERQEDNRWKVRPFLGPEAIFMLNIENYIPGTISDSTRLKELVPGGTFGIKTGPLVLGFNINGRNYLSNDFEHHPVFGPCNEEVGGTDITKDINSKMRIYGASIGLDVFRGLTLYGGIQKNIITSDITGIVEQWISDPAENRRYIKFELTPEKKIAEYWNERFGLGYNGNVAGLNGGVVLNDWKFDGVYANLVVYFRGK